MSSAVKRAALVETPPISLPSSHDARLVTLLAAAASLIALVVYFPRGDLLLYGDAVAHINIARRMFDSLTPGFGQLGTVWLPLPHLLMVPFVGNHWLWQTGVAGAIPSLFAFAMGTLGIFCLVREAVAGFGASAQVVRASGWLAALIYATNPNLLYLATTAMNEPLYLALFIWALVWLQRFGQRVVNNRRNHCAGRALLACGLLIAAAEMTRYDGWFAAGCIVIAATAIAIQHRAGLSPKFRRVFLVFLLLSCVLPTLWLTYNYVLHGNALDFANGPYSAFAIEHRGVHWAGPLHPGDHNLKLAAIYVLRVSEGDLGQSMERFAMLLVAAAGAMAAVWLRKGRLVLLLFAPLPFYIYSVAFGSIPIFTPELYPWSYYNTRYGTAVLPAVAAWIAVAAAMAASRMRQPRWQAAVFCTAVVLAAATYVSAYVIPHHRGWSFPDEPNAGPLVWREAKVNAVSRVRFESRLARELAMLDGNTRLLMDCSNHVGALQDAGRPLHSVINEANWPFWQWALRAPAREADFVVAIADDPVDAAVHAQPEGLERIAIVEGDPGQVSATIYRSLVRNRRDVRLP